MVKHAQTIRRQKAINCLSVFDHFVGLALKGLIVVSLLQMSSFSALSFALHFLRLKPPSKNLKFSF